MQRGDVVRVNLPPPVGRQGHEQFGSRPAIIIESGTISANPGTIVVIPLTSNRDRLRLRGSVLITKSKQNGLTIDSVALTSQIRAIDKQRTSGLIGALSTEDLANVENAIRQILGL